jgi:hypothetical protein
MGAHHAHRAASANSSANMPSKATICSWWRAGETGFKHSPRRYTGNTASTSWWRRSISRMLGSHSIAPRLCEQGIAIDILITT